MFPIAGPWINGGVIKSLSNMDSGVQPSGSETCEDNDGLAVSLACFLSTMDQQKTKDVANILTTNSVAEAHLRVQALILENFLNEVENPVNAAKNSIAAELPEIAAEIDAVEKKVAEGNSLNDMVASFKYMIFFLSPLSSALKGFKEARTRRVSMASCPKTSETR